MIKDSSKLEKGQDLQIDISEVHDRLPNKTRAMIEKNPVGKLVGYKMVDGNQFGLAIKLSDGTITWFFENELSEINDKE